MRINSKNFDINSKNELIAKYNVKPVRGIKGLNEKSDSVYVSNKGDILIFNLFRRLYYTYTYISYDEINKYIDGSGYPIIRIKHTDLTGNQYCHTFKLHRLVACTWIDNPYNLRDVDHIDGNKLNNSIDNLEWVTHAENCKRYWDKRVHNTTRLYIECCNANMGVVQTVNIGDYKIRYRKCKYCGRRVITRQDVNKNEVIVKNI